MPNAAKFGREYPSASVVQRFGAGDQERAGEGEQQHHGTANHAGRIADGCATRLGERIHDAVQNRVADTSAQVKCTRVEAGR